MGYTEGFLDGLRQAGDSSADIVIDKLARAEQVRAVSDVLRSLTYNDQPVQAGELTRQIARRNHRRSDEGILMPRALFELHSGSLPAGFEGAAPALTRYLLGDEVCTLVGLPRSRWDNAMNWQAGVGRVLDRAQSARGPVGSLTKMVGAGILNQRVVGMAGRHSASSSIPVPPELHRRWTASGVFPRIDPELIEIAQAQQA